MKPYDGTRLATILADPANGAFKGTVLKQAQFDLLGRIKTLDIGLNGTSPVATVDYTYHASNARLIRVRGMIGATTPVDLSVGFDGLGRLTSQTGTLGAETVSRSYTYDGLSRLKTASGPWEKPLGFSGNVTWTYGYDPLGNLRTLASSRGASGDNRTWAYGDAVRPHFLTSFAQQGQATQTMPSNAFGEPTMVDRGGGNQEPFVWNAQGKLYSYKSSLYSWDGYDQNTLVVTAGTSIVRVGADFEYDLTAGRATKYFSVDGVRIAVLATVYSPPAASLPPALYPVVRALEPLEAPAVVVLFIVGLGSLGAIATRRRRSRWVAVPGVGMLGLVVVALPYSAVAATLPPGGPGTYGRPAEALLAYLTDHLGSVRAVVNASGTIVETRDYDPFGGDIAHTGTFSVQHRFTGQPADDQAGGLYNYGARFYNAKWGRFTSPDELVQGFDSQGLNPYAYAGNAPTSAIDPSGHDFYLPPISIPSLAGTFAGASWPSGGLGESSAGAGRPIGARDLSGRIIYWGLWGILSSFGIWQALGMKNPFGPDDSSGGGDSGGGGDGNDSGAPPTDIPSTTLSLALGSLPQPVPVSSSQLGGLGPLTFNWIVPLAPVLGIVHFWSDFRFRSAALDGHLGFRSPPRDRPSQ